MYLSEGERFIEVDWQGDLRHILSNHAFEDTVPKEREREEKYAIKGTATAIKERGGEYAIKGRT